MTSLEFLELLNNVSDKYVAEARTPARKRLSLGRSLLVAAIILMSLLLVGCTVAYVNGWFTDYFSARSENPLTPEQVEFIQEHEQIIQAPQAKGDWTVELKSAICDGNNAYVIFGITAPEDVDLEDTNLSTGADRDRIIPGNASSMVRDPESPIPFTNSMSTTSVLCISPEYNTVWRDSCRWEPDNDGLPNTLNYVFSITIDKYDPSKEILLEDPFASDIEFQFVFQDFIRTWEDPEKRAEIDAKYAGQDYLIDGEELDGLYKYETLVEETWEFTVTFDPPAPAESSVELITGEPVTTWAEVYWRVPADNPMGYDIDDGEAEVKITSFVLNPFGATLTYEYFQEGHNNAFIEYESHYGYTRHEYAERRVYVVMKDGSRIPLHTDQSGDKLKADAPIVLSEVDHILLGDGVQISMPE